MIIDLSKSRKVLFDSLDYYILIHKLKYNKHELQRISIFLYLIILIGLSDISVNAENSYFTCLHKTINTHNILPPLALTACEILKQRASIVWGYKYLISKI